MTQRPIIIVGTLVLLLLPFKIVQTLTEPLGYLASAALAYLWMLGALLLWWIITGRPRLPTPPGRFSLAYLWKGGLTGIGLFVLAGIGYAITQGVFGVEQPPETQALRIGGIGEAVVVVLISIVLAVVIEEVAFRGFILERLNDTLPTGTAVLLSAALFSIYHLSAFQFLSTFLMGLGFALLVVRLKSLYPALVAHATINGFGVVLFSLGATQPGG